MHYRRVKIEGASYFFTINLANRKSTLLLEQITNLKSAINIVKTKHPFKIDGIVVMPEHLHILLSLPQNDADYSTRISLIKSYFSRSLSQVHSKCQGSVWQRRFWEHCIRNERDYEHHLNYIHYNPVKHGYVKKPSQWPYSSIHRYTRLGIIPENWGCEESSFRYEYGE